MANEVYLREGTQLLVNNGTGKNYTWTVEALANAAGRVSVQIDLGAAPRPYRFKWVCECQFQATPTQYKGLEIYRACAPSWDNTRIDGDIGLVDAALADVDMRQNLKFIGYVVSENAAASEKCNASGIFEHEHRYISFVAYNDSGAAVNATADNFKFWFEPIWYQGQ